MVECAMKYCFVAHDPVVAIDAGKTFLIFVQSKRVVFLNIKNGALLRVLHYIPHQVGNLCSMDPRIPVIPKHRKHSFQHPSIDVCLLGCKIDRLNPTRFLVYSNDRTASMWSTVTLELLGRFQGHTSTVVGADFGARGHCVFTAGEDGLLMKHQISSGKIVATTKIGASFLSLAVVNFYRPPDPGHGGNDPGETVFGMHDRIVSALNDGTCRIWSCEENAITELVRVQTHGPGDVQCALSPDATMFTVCAIGPDPCILYDSTTVHQMMNFRRSANAAIYEISEQADHCISARQAFDEHVMDVFSNEKNDSYGGSLIHGTDPLQDVLVAARMARPPPINVEYTLGKVGNLKFGHCTERVGGQSVMRYHAITAVDYSDSSQCFLTATTDCKLSIWHCSRREEYRLAYTIKLPAPPTSAIFVETHHNMYVHAVCKRRVLVFEFGMYDESASTSHMTVRRSPPAKVSPRTRGKLSLGCTVPFQGEQAAVVPASPARSARYAGGSINAGTTLFGRPKREPSMGYSKSPRQMRASHKLRHMGNRGVDNHKLTQDSLYTVMYLQPPRHNGLDGATLRAMAESYSRSAEERARAERIANINFMAQWMEQSRQRVMARKRLQEKELWDGPDPAFLSSSLAGPQSMDIVWEELKEKQVGVDGDRVRETLAQRATGQW